MASSTVPNLKFLGSISVGLLTGLSYSLSTLTVPTLLGFSSASSASRAFNNLTTDALSQFRILAGVSSSSFLLAYLLSPHSRRHPYLLWTSLFVAGSGLTDLVLPYITGKSTTGARPTQKPKDKKGKAKQQPQIDASYDLLGHDSNSEGTQSDQEIEEEVNGEEVRDQMEGFMTSQIIRTAIAGLGFAMSVVGIWGDGAADVVIVEL